MITGLLMRHRRHQRALQFRNQQLSKTSHDLRNVIRSPKPRLKRSSPTLQNHYSGPSPRRSESHGWSLLDLAVCPCSVSSDKVSGRPRNNNSKHRFFKALARKHLNPSLYYTLLCIKFDHVLSRKSPARRPLKPIRARQPSTPP